MLMALTNRCGVSAGAAAFAALVLAASAGLAWGQDAAEPARPDGPIAVQPGAAKEVAPEAKRVLDRVAAFYKALPGAKVTAKISMKAPNPDGEGEPMSQESEISMAAADPNKFVFPTETGGQFDQFKIVSTGETVYMFYGAPMNKYSAKPAPASYDGVIEAMSMGERADLSSLATPMVPVLKLMEGRSLAEMEDVQKVEYLGQEDVGGQKTEHVKLIGKDHNDRPGADVDVWVRSGELAWVEQIKPDMTKGLAELGDVGEQLKKTMPEVTVTFSGWESIADFPATTFAFTPPEGAEKVESLMDAMRDEAGGGDEGDAEAAHEALMGKAAPELGLAVLGGGEAKLSEAKGKVVILDFWATWCPPCVRGLPAIHGIAEKYKDKGVVFYAVNQQEDEATISKFLEKRKLPGLKVALDAKGKAAEAYGVSGIPQTVLIGKDGTVQSVHVGFMPGMEKDIEEQIEKLLKGEALHKPAGDAPPKGH
jgi:thiol-disulfide isomerase/thioredoxin